MERRPADRRRLSRRGFLAGAGALVAAGGAAAAGVLLTRGGGGTPATPVPETPTPGTPTATPSTTTPTGQPWVDTPPETLIEEVPGAWVREDLDLAQEVDWEHGILFLDTATRTLTGWRVQEAAIPPGAQAHSASFRYLTGPGGALIWTRGDVPFLHSRTSGRSWKIAENRLYVVNCSEHHALLVYADPLSDVRPAPTTDFAVVELETFRLLHGFSGKFQGSCFSSDGRWLALVEETADGSDLTLTLFELATGNRAEIYRLPRVRDGWLLSTPRLEENAAGLLEIEWRYNHPVDERQAPAAPAGRGAFGAVRWLGDGQAVPLRESTLERAAMEYPRPDHQVFAQETILRARGGYGGEGGGERWTAVTLVDRAGAPLFRVRSATLSYGDWLTRGHWLPDGSGLLVAIPGQPPAGRQRWWFDGVAYAVLRLDGTLEPLPPLPGREDDIRWVTGAFIRGPSAAPGDADLISFGRIDLLRRSTGEWTSIRLGPRAEPSHVDPWATGNSREMVLALGHGGHGGWGVPAWADPLVEYPPFDDRMTLRVAVDGDCLNFRDRAEPDAPVIRCLPDGTELDLAEFTPPHADSPQSTWSSEDGTRWVYVQTAEGTVGWVAMDYLAWA